MVAFLVKALKNKVSSVKAKDTRHRQEEILNQIIKILQKYLNPDKILLFGSRLNQGFDNHSDFDLAVDKEKADIRLQRRIREEIDESVGLYSVDIVYLNSVDESFRNIIWKTGRVVYERKGQICT